MAKIKVLNQDITAVKYNDEDYISLTDIINNWIRNRGTLEFIGTWEQLSFITINTTKCPLNNKKYSKIKVIYNIK